MVGLRLTEAGYDVIDVVVVGEDGQRIKAQAFSTNWTLRLFEEVPPSVDYISKIRVGAEFHKLPDHYQVRLPWIIQLSSYLLCASMTAALPVQTVRNVYTGGMYAVVYSRSALVGLGIAVTTPHSPPYACW
jgi:hypothetical protein